MRENKHFSFTLVEAVIVAGLFSLVGLFVLRAFVSGSNIWQRVYQDDVKERVGIFFEEFTKDVTNTLAMKDSYLFGSETFLEFPTVITYSAQFGTMAKGPGRVRYAFFVDRGIFGKTIRTITDIYKNSPGFERTVLENVTECSVSYYYFDDESASYLWVDKWNNDFLPLAISIRISVRSNDITHSFNKNERTEENLSAS